MYDGWARMRFSTRAPAEDYAQRLIFDTLEILVWPSYLDPVAGSRWPLLAVGIGSIREDTLQELITTGTDEVEQVLGK